MRITGVYHIKNTHTGWVFLGQSVNVKNRWYHHKFMLRRGLHKNILLQQSYDKYGSDVFEFKVLAQGAPDDLTKLKQRFIKKNLYRCYNYNSAGKPYGGKVKLKKRKKLVVLKKLTSLDIFKIGMAQVLKKTVKPMV